MPREEWVEPGDTLWPTQLNKLKNPPARLYYRGKPELLLTPMVAMVGARAATGYGEHVTMEMASGLVEHEQTIVSGAAYGIDGMAHRAALASNGKTIAVMAGGLDRFYPSGHESLLNRIVDEGLVVSEYPVGTPPIRWQFLQRNRIIAALSSALVVVEAGMRSGSLSAARHALSINVPVGAVPGPVTSAASAGCHKLIRVDGATLVTGYNDVLSMIGVGNDEYQSPTFTNEVPEGDAF